MERDESPREPEVHRDLRQLKRRAKELLRDFRRGDPDAVRSVGEHFTGADPESFRLAHAQLVLARSLGHASWARLRAVCDAPRGSSAGRRRTQPARMRTGSYVCDVNAVDGDRAWALFEACRDGDVEAVRSLVRADANLVHAQNWYTQPIHFAVYADRPEVLRVLLEAGSEPGRIRFMYGGWDQLLERAEEMGFEETYRVLRDALRERFGFDPGFERLADAIRSRELARVEATLADEPALARACDVSGNNAVHWAVMTRQPELVSLLVAAGADVDHRRSDGQTPAHVLLNGDYAFRVWRDLKGIEHADDPTVMRALLDAGAEHDLSIACASGDRDRVDAILARDPDAARRLDSGRRSPLAYAARSGHLEVVRALLEHGADPNRPEELAKSGSALFEACGGGHADVVELLLENGADPNAESDSSGVCVSIARHRFGDGADAIVDLLRRHGATVPLWELSVDDMRAAIERDESVCRDFEFELEALARNDVDLAKDLLARDPSLVERLHGGCLRLGSADVAVTESAVLRLLLEAGFDPNRPDWLGVTALHHYAGRGELQNALLVIEHGADVDALDDELHGTPLAWAARGGHADTVRLLLEHGADASLPRELTPATPLARARAAGHADVVALLEVGAP